MQTNPGMQNNPGGRIMARCEALRAISENDHDYTRRYLTVEHRRAADIISDWMIEAGLSARMDAAGNVVGRLEGRSYGLPALVLGSHFDTVPNGGRYDGQLGVVTAIEVASSLKTSWRDLPFAIEVYAFGDEEGTRFNTGYLASGQLVEQRIGGDLMIADSEGTTLDEAMRAFGLDPDQLSAALRDPQDLIGYLEVHIEQGPVLEANNLAVASVTSIAAAKRLMITVTGCAGHAGTVPMTLRQDALAAACEMVLALERHAFAAQDLVATVGLLEVGSPAMNVIPGTVSFSIDIRSPNDADLDRAFGEAMASLSTIANKRHVTIATQVVYESSATAMDPRIIAAIDGAALKIQGEARQLASGAGHDAAMMAKLCPAGMIFVRCKGGISHHPDEAITEADAATGFYVMHETVISLAASFGSKT